MIGQDAYVTFTEAVTFTPKVDADPELKVNNSVATAGNLSTVTGNSKQVKFTLDAAPTATPSVKVNRN